MSDFSKFAWLKAAEEFRLSALEHEVMMAIHNRSHKDGTEAYVTEKKLAGKFGKSDRQIRRALTRLKDLGLIERTHRGTKDSSHSIYKLTMPETQPDIPTGHFSKSQPDILGRPNRTLSEPTGHSVSEPTGHWVSGITDPFNRSRKGSVPDPPVIPDIASDVRLTVESSETLKGLVTVEPSQSYRPAPIEGQPHHTVIPVIEGTNPVNVDQVDPFSPQYTPQVLTARREQYPDQWLWESHGYTLKSWSSSEPFPRLGTPGADPKIRFMDEESGEFLGVCPPAIVPRSQITDQFSFDLEAESVDADPNRPPTVVPWPRTKPIPVDPWCSFVDDQTGEPFAYTPGKLPTPA